MRVSRTSLWQPSLEAGLPTSRPWGLQTALFSTGAQFQCGQCGTSAVGEQSFVCMRRGDMAMDMAAGEARVTPKFLNTINSSVPLLVSFSIIYCSMIQTPGPPW